MSDTPLTVGEHASMDSKSDLYPGVAELWDCEGRVAFVAGNYVRENGTIWLFDWDTCAVGYRPVVNLTTRADRRSLTETQILERFTEWARGGSADAMWWLAFWFEGRHHPRSVWYYVAAMRADPRQHAWVRSRLNSDARSAMMCEGVPQPDLAFLADIPEMQGEAIAQDWREAVAQAEAAVHTPALETATRAQEGFWINAPRMIMTAYRAPGDQPCAAAVTSEQAGTGGS